MKLRIIGYSLNPEQVRVTIGEDGTFRGYDMKIPLPTEPLTEETFLQVVKKEIQKLIRARTRFAWIAENEQMEFEIDLEE